VCVCVCVCNINKVQLCWMKLLVKMPRMLGFTYELQYIMAMHWIRRVDFSWRYGLQVLSVQNLRSMSV